MADARTHRQEKKQEKKRAKDKDKARSIRTRRAGGAGSVSAEQAAGWPLGECYISQDWHEKAPQIQAIFTRLRKDGRMAAALFELDLAEAGVKGARLELDWKLSSLQQVLVALSREKPLVVCEPGLVVKVVQEAAKLGEGSTPQLARARALFGEIKPSSSEILTGAAPAPKAEEASESKGFLSSIRRLFTGNRS